MREVEAGADCSINGMTRYHIFEWAKHRMSTKAVCECDLAALFELGTVNFAMAYLPALIAGRSAQIRWSAPATGSVV